MKPGPARLPPMAAEAGRPAAPAVARLGQIPSFDAGGRRPASAGSLDPDAPAHLHQVMVIL